MQKQGRRFLVWTAGWTLVHYQKLDTEVRQEENQEKSISWRAVSTKEGVVIHDRGCKEVN